MTTQTTQEDRYGNALATQSATAAQRYSDAVDRALAGNVGALEGFDAAIAADEGFALAHVAAARLRQLRGEGEAARAGAARARSLVEGASARERRHVETLTVAIEGQAPRALAMLLEHVREFPRDAFLLSQATGVYGLIGFSGSQDRNQDQAVLLEGLAPAYGDDWWFLSALAFAQVEDFQFERAHGNAERSLQLFHENAYGAHTMAHVLYEVGDSGSGAAFLADWIPGYDRAAELHTHLSWHWALFVLNQGDFDAVLEIYRRNIRPGVSQAPPLSLMADCASILWRSDLYGAKRELPWAEVRDFAAATFRRPGLMWADVHCALAYAGVGDQASLDQWVTAIRERHKQGKIRAGEVVPRLAEGIAAFVAGDFDGVIRILEPVADQVVRIGGSHAQREIFEDTLLEAYLRAGHLDVAETWLRKRLDRRPSPRDLRWLERATAGQPGAE